MYKIVRLYFNDEHKQRTIKKGLTLSEAQAHCHSKETSSTSCTSDAGRQETNRKGPWFDCYQKEK